MTTSRIRYSCIPEERGRAIINELFGKYPLETVPQDFAAAFNRLCGDFEISASAVVYGVFLPADEVAYLGVIDYKKPGWDSLTKAKFFCFSANQ